MLVIFRHRTGSKREDIQNQNIYIDKDKSKSFNQG
jgi:hypothetical protein